jgi:hypothetical protein
MARKKYTLIGGTAATKVIDLSPRPAKTEPKRKKAEHVEEAVVVEEQVAVEETASAEETAVEESAPTDEG